MEWWNSSISNHKKYSAKSCGQYIAKFDETQHWRLERSRFSFNPKKKSNAKECFPPIALITTKIVSKNSPSRKQRELPNVHAGLKKRKFKNQIASAGSSKNMGFQKNIYFAFFIDLRKAKACGSCKLDQKDKNTNTGERAACQVEL